MEIGQAFDNTVSYYDGWMQKALPNFNDLFSTAVQIIPYKTDRPIEVLDLGAGTGLFSKFVFQKYPKARFVLYDLGGKMLNLAKERFKESQSQFEYIVGDYRFINATRTYDLVISSLSIHHLAEGEKKALFIQIYKLINQGGMFINIDQVRGETQGIRDLYWNHWLEQVNASDATREQIEDSIFRRTTYDKDANMADQLQWLKNAGFNDVDCVYKNYFVGVFMGSKE